MISGLGRLTVSELSQEYQSVDINHSMDNKISIVLVGIGGYGLSYVSALLDNDGSGNRRIAAVVDPYPDKCNRIGDLRARSIPIYDSLAKFYRHGTANLAIISSPIQCHCPQSCLAVSKGTYVLCEKPMCATVAEAETMRQAQRDSGKWIAIGYQWSFSATIQEVKQQIQEGAFGRPIRFKSLMLTPRGERYYNRNDWAGRIRDSRGRYVFDSPVNNACAHYLHNMFYLLGGQPNTSAACRDVTAELYRANNIENFDTAALRAYTDDGVEILFYTSHACEQTTGAAFSFELEHATIQEHAQNHANLIAHFKDGSTRDFGSFEATPMAKLWQCIECVDAGK